MKRARKLALLTAGVLCATLAVLTGLASAATGTPFADVGTFPNGPIGVAVSSSQLLASEWCAPQIDSISDTGVVSPYATLPASAVPGCIEMYMAFSPGTNGWPSAGNLFVGQANLIYQVGPGGGSVTLFATLPATQCNDPVEPPHTGITFDTVGTFGNDMIVTCANGQVWRVNAAGTPTLVVSTGTFIEGPAVVPTSYGSLGGQIWVNNESNNEVDAVSTSGVVTPVVTFHAPEDVEVVPPNPCNFGNSGGSMFGAMYDSNSSTHAIWKWAASDLAPQAGNVLVTSEASAGTAVITPSGGGYTTTPFSSETIPHEGADILNCAAPPPPPGGIIAPTQTTCQDYTSGTAQTLGQVNYSVVGGKIGQGINPGVFFYYTKITTTTANQIVTVSQSNTSTNNTPLFGILNGQAWLYPADCSSHTSGTVTGPNGSGASYTIPTPGTYIIGIKYQTKTIAGAPAPVPADITYNFSTSLGGSTGASVLLKKQ
jgi:hypothetical protein